MKILRLSLNNLASLAGTHQIRFDETPLAHAGLIAITGKTGAGKSTLLDAMCLALYNEVPRLKGAAGSLKDLGGQDISIKDSKNILRRGTTSGFAELEFVALDGKRYQARWEIRRARNKIDGNLKIDRAITCLDDQCVLNQKISEATPIVEKLIGLSFEQFTRAVLLAQSEVGAFLKAKDNERADLLEYLTNSHIFSLVSIKAAEKNSQIKQQRLELEKLMGHIEMLSADDLEQLNQKHKQLSLQLQNLQQSEKILENEKKWHLDRNRIYADLHGKKEIYEVQLDAVNKSVDQQQLLDQLDLFQSIREQFVQRAQLEPEQQQLTQQQRDFNQEFEHIKQKVAEEVSKLNILKQQQSHFQHYRESIQPHLETGLTLDHEINSISEQYKKLNTELTQFHSTRLVPLEQQLQSQTVELSAAQNQLAQLQSQLIHTEFLKNFDQEPQSVLQRLKDYSRQFKALKDKIQLEATTAQATLEFEHIPHKIATIRTSIQNWSTQYSSIENLQDQLKHSQQQYQSLQKQQYQIELLEARLQQWNQNLITTDKLNLELQTQQGKLQIEQENIRKLQNQLDTERQAFQQLEQVLNEQRLLHTQSVQELRAQLKSNAACMVCGSLEHPYVDNHALLEQSLLQLQAQQLNQAKIQLEQTHAELQSKQILCSKLETVIEQQQQLQLQWTQQNSDTLEMCTAAFKMLSIEVDPTQHPAELLKTIQHQQQQIQQQLTQFEMQEQEQQVLLQTWRSSLQKLQQLQIAEHEYEVLKQLIHPVQEALPEVYQQQLATEWLEDIQNQLQQRQQLLQQYKNLEAQIQVQQQSLDKTQYHLQLEQNNYAQLTQKIEQLIEHGKDLRQQLAELTQQHADKVYRVAAEWRAELDQQAKVWQQQLESQSQIVLQTEQQLNQANLKLQALVTQAEQLEKQLESANKAIYAWRLQHPHVSDALIQQCLKVDLVQHQRLRQDLSNQKQLLDNAKTAWQLLEEQYQVHLKQQPVHRFEEVEAQLIDLNNEKNNVQDQCNSIAAQLHMNSNNQATFAKYQHQIEQIKAEEYRWGRIYDLIGHKEGTKFQKIAQEHHLDILVEYANQQLQPLSPRYQLHRIPDSLSLAIVDLDMNSEIRPVLSLSGGETFLVSLALALAIANMASGSMKLESLFIDEGFGTLDPASLHMVMNALDHLQSQGRKVVLISHVQEMHERIPVQIQVKPVGAGASTIEIVG